MKRVKKGGKVKILKNGVEGGGSEWIMGHCPGLLHRAVGDGKAVTKRNGEAGRGFKSWLTPKISDGR